MINTTQIDDWTGRIQEVGPMYPFPGWEWLMVILVVVFWITWIVLQWRMESSIYKEDEETYGDQVSMSRIVKGDHFSLSRTDIPKVPKQ